MASCSFSTLFKLTSPGGSNAKDAKHLQCVTLKEFNKDVNSYLISLKIGPDEAIHDEMALLLARAGKVSGLRERTLFRNCSVFFFSNKLIAYCLNFILGIFTIDSSLSSLTLCPHHREKYGLRWRSGKVRCCVPKEVAGHQSSTTKGDRGMNSKESSFISNTVRELHPVGTRKLYLKVNVVTIYS